MTPYYIGGSQTRLYTLVLIDTHWTVTLGLGFNHIRLSHFIYKKAHNIWVPVQARKQFFRTRLISIIMGFVT